MPPSKGILEDLRKSVINIDTHQTGNSSKAISKEFTELKQFCKEEGAKDSCCAGLITSYQKLLVDYCSSGSQQVLKAKVHILF